MTRMKGITCCGDCGYYNWKKHKCTRATDEGDARDKFYADCPLPDVVAVPVVRCSECKFGKLCIDADGHSLIQCTNTKYPTANVETWPLELDWYCAGGERRDGET